MRGYSLRGVPPRLAVDTEIYASHHQFYVVDADEEYRADFLWDGGGLERHLGVADGIVGVGTIGYTFLPVSIEVWDGVPPLDLEDWDHVAEASLEVRSGNLGLEGVEGPSELEPIAVEPGTYRVRSAACGLDGADEMDGGDSYRVQLWSAPAAPPDVLKWWAPWNPSDVAPRPSTSGGRIVLGVEAHDLRMKMRWLGSRGVAHLFRDDDGVLWEHSTLSNAAGTPQLEELDREEAERRYGPEAKWGPPSIARPSVGGMLRSIWQTWRYSRGWRPREAPSETVLESGLRVVRGADAISRLYTMTGLTSESGDTLYRDAEGALWELNGDSIRRSDPTLAELTPEQAESKYGALD